MVSDKEKNKGVFQMKKIRINIIVEEKIYRQLVKLKGERTWMDMLIDGAYAKEASPEIATLPH